MQLEHILPEILSLGMFFFDRDKYPKIIFLPNFFVHYFFAFS
jgi:hypothetical protein